MTSNKKTNHYLLATVTVVISLAICWAVGEFFLSKQKQNIAQSSAMEPGLMRYHPQLGWSLSPSWQGRHQHYDFDVAYSTNLFGLRNGNTSSPLLLSNNAKPRIALIGDSFTFGFGVNDNETFHAELSARDTTSDYINGGIPGYSTDQQYLFIKHSMKDFSIDHYILVFYLGNDLLDNPLPFPLQASRGKPFFELKDQQLHLKNVPVPKQQKTATLQSATLNSVVFGKELEKYSTPSSRLIQSSNILSLLLPQQAQADKNTVNAILEQRLHEQEQLFAALLKAIKTTTAEQQASLTLALMPGRSFVVAPQSYSALFQDYIRAKTTTIAAELDIPVIDIAAELATQYQTGDHWFHPNEGHLTAAGNKKVAEIIWQQ